MPATSAYAVLNHVTRPQRAECLQVYIAYWIEANMQYGASRRSPRVSKLQTPEAAVDIALMSAPQNDDRG